jgi:hypothetical protein
MDKPALVHDSKCTLFEICNNKMIKRSVTDTSGVDGKTDHIASLRPDCVCHLYRCLSQP